jgi:hypothetical protein
LEKVYQHTGRVGWHAICLEPFLRLRIVKDYPLQIRFTNGHAQHLSYFPRAVLIAGNVTDFFRQWLQRSVLWPLQGQ